MISGKKNVKVTANQTKTKDKKLHLKILSVLKNMLKNVYLENRDHFWHKLDLASYLCI